MKTKSTRTDRRREKVMSEQPTSESVQRKFTKRTHSVICKRGHIHSALFCSTQQSPLLTANYLHSALSTQHFALQLPTADCQLFSFSVLRTQHFLSFPSTDFIAHCRLPTLFIFAQHSALSTSFFGCRLPTIHLPSLKNQPYKKFI